MACVAAPIRDHTGAIRYGVSISTLTLEHTMEQIESMAHDAVATAGRISAALGYSLPARPLPARSAPAATSRATRPP